jgi:L-alanine-DL-glutamate epimerase-like enolase superfamily enzyme
MDTDQDEFAATELHKGDAVADAIRRRFDFFLGEDPMMTERLWHMMWEVDRVEEFALHTACLLDVLSWDLKSKIAGVPLFQLAGGHDSRVRAYASTVTWDTVDDYERHIKQCMDVGFTAFKLHAWGDPKEDAELVRRLRQWTGPDADLMFDGSAGWDYVTALEFGRVLETEGYLWYEEPMREFYLGAYQRLCDALDIPVLAAETSDGAHWNVASWIEAGALDMVRTSCDMKAGFTGALRIAHMADSFGMRAQVHGMGLANAQLCAAIPNNDFYEQLVIDEAQIRGLAAPGPLAIVDGYLEASSEPGLGHQYDWEHVDEAALARVDVTKDGVSERRRGRQR